MRSKSRRLTHSLLLFGILSLVLFLNAPTESGTAPTPPLIKPKASPVIDATSQRLFDRIETDGRVKAWIFFIDKGVYTQSQLQTALARRGPAISAKAAARRAKMGIYSPQFVDLPVVDKYVRTLQERGAELRRTSRWLNAASVEIEGARLSELAALPFVREIRPMLRYPSPRVKQEQKLPVMPKALEPGPFDYGSAAGQLSMIGVPLAHDAGYDGAGVLVCMLDTGYRINHEAFATAFSEMRVKGQRDFVFGDNIVQNEPEDSPSAHNHGTYTWSTLGGEVDGTLYGPAFKADFLLGKTEDVRSEEPIEEDNWVAGMEWADSAGADVISSSLGYIDWYTADDLNGDYAVTTVAADIAASLGIVVCNSAGNGGSQPSTLIAPADADTILSVGAVSSSKVIVSFSSRGPTADNRTKPEVCAQGLSTYCATASTNNSYGGVSGTSLSCPLVGGAAALLIQAHPDWTPVQVREALMMTADRASQPNNDYGWGIINVMDAINYTGFEVCDCGTPGDFNDDGTIDPLDMTILINYLFRGHEPPAEPPNCPLSRTDWNCDGVSNPLDAVYMVNFVYRGYPEAAPCDPCNL